MAVSKRVFVKIVLMILLGNDEILKWRHLNHDLIFKFLSNFALPSSAPLKTHLLPLNLHPKIPPKPRENLISFSCELLFLKDYIKFKVIKCEARGKRP